jgi:fructose-bisphosphate aldolase class II
MEAEVGEVPRVGISSSMDPQAGLTRPEDAAAFARVTGVDTLAVAIGSVHAVQTKSMALDLERLRAIRAVVSLPLVLHGSSGVTDETLLEGIRLGLAKVNVATQLSQGFTHAARRVLEADPAEVDLRKYLGPARAAMVAVVRERLRLLGASNKI